MAALVLGLHAGLLGLVTAHDAPVAGVGAPPTVVTVRQVAVLVPAPAAMPPPNPRPTAPETERPRPAAQAPAERPAAEPPVPLGPAIRLPTDVAIDFEWRLGDQVGVAWLEGCVVDGRYELRLEGRMDDRPALRWHSQGAVDAQGLAPERFVAQRGRRPAQAVNFDREGRRIRFSATTTEWPLTPGVQDRLSWLLQLPAIVDAEPTLRHPGARIQMVVVGVRGDAGPWDFEVQGLEPMALAGQFVDALHLVRRPQRPYDTEVAVWLDPAAGHLPVRLRLSTPDSGESAEFLRR